MAFQRYFRAFPYHFLIYAETQQLEVKGLQCWHDGVSEGMKALGFNPLGVGCPTFPAWASIIFASRITEPLQVESKSVS